MNDIAQQFKPRSEPVTSTRSRRATSPSSEPETRTKRHPRVAMFVLIGAAAVATLLLATGITCGAIHLLGRGPSQPGVTAVVEGTTLPTSSVQRVTILPVVDSPKPASKVQANPIAGEAKPAIPEVASEEVQFVSNPPKKTKPKETPSVLDRVKKSTCLIEGKDGWGTGFVIQPGIVMTNAHVIAGRIIDDLRVSFVSVDDTAPPALKVTLLYYDKRRDLAILRVDTDRLPLECVPAGTTLQGLEVAVVGNPKGDGGQAEINKVTTGKLSAPIRRNAGWTYYELQAQAYFGNSGGPVVDLKTGKLVGVMQSILGDGKYKSYCIPHAEASRALQTLPESKEKEPTASRVALGRHYLDFIATRLPEIEKNADLAMQGQLARLLSRGDDVTVTVTTVDGKTFNMSLAELMAELREEHTATYKNIQKVMPKVEASSEIPSSLKQVLRERIETCASMRALAGSRTNLETTFRREMASRKNFNETKVKAFATSYEKFLDDLDRKTPAK